jgi:hypothetical protein
MNYQHTPTNQRGYFAVKKVLNDTFKDFFTLKKSHIGKLITIFC